MPFSRRPTSRLLIESQTLTIWPCSDLDLIYDLDLRQVKPSLNWCPGSKISIFYEMPLTLTPITLILKLDLDMVKMYHHTKNEVSMSTGSKVITQTDTDRHTHTHRHDENITSTAYAGGNKDCSGINIKKNFPFTHGQLQHTCKFNRNTKRYPF